MFIFQKTLVKVQDNTKPRQINSQFSSNIIAAMFYDINKSFLLAFFV